MRLDAQFNNVSSALPQASTDIKLWSSAAQSLGATSSYQDSYPAWRNEPAPSQLQPAYTPNPHRCDGTTTAAQDYQAWRVQPPPVPTPAATPCNPHRCEGTTTSQDAYRTWRAEPAPAQLRPAYTPNPHRCDGTTTAHESYRSFQLPRSVLPSLGVLINGGSFHELIPAGERPWLRSWSPFQLRMPLYATSSAAQQCTFGVCSATHRSEGAWAHTDHSWLARIAVKCE